MIAKQAKNHKRAEEAGFPKLDDSHRTHDPYICYLGGKVEDAKQYGVNVWAEANVYRSKSN